jgi:hypothetical protein
MSEYTGVRLHKFQCIYLDLCIFIPGFLSLYRFKIYINTRSNPTTTAVDPISAPIPIAAELLSSSDATVTQEVDNAINHFCLLFGNVDWLKTGRMTFYRKWNSTDVTNYSYTHSIYKFIFCTIYQCSFRNISTIHNLAMYFTKFQQISKISKYS